MRGKQDFRSNLWHRQESSPEPVKITQQMSDYYAAYMIIRLQIEAGLPAGIKDAVVLSSMGWFFDKNNLQDRAFMNLIGGKIDKILGRGVPIILASGNEGGLIPSYPQDIESRERPIINIGGTTQDGFVLPGSQGGPQLTIHAPGERLTCHTKKDWEMVDKSGTSIAAPAVAGVIATYMSYDKPPWRVKDRNKARVHAIKDFIRSPSSPWERKLGFNMIWNGADKGAHEGANPPICQRDGHDCNLSPLDNLLRITSQYCNGIETKHYITAGTIGKLIDEDFYPDAAEQGRTNNNEAKSIKRTHLNGPWNSPALKSAGARMWTSSPTQTIARDLCASSS